jgi:hypothetical protein
VQIRSAVLFKAWGLACFRIILILATCLVISGAMDLISAPTVHAKCMIVHINPQTGQPVRDC